MMTEPLQTTTYDEVTYPVYQRELAFLHRLPQSSVTPWIIGPVVGDGGGWIFFGESPACPSRLTYAEVYNSETNEVEALNTDAWSISCVGGE